MPSPYVVVYSFYRLMVVQAVGGMRGCAGVVLSKSLSLFADHPRANAFVPTFKEVVRRLSLAPVSLHVPPYHVARAHVHSRERIRRAARRMHALGGGPTLWGAYGDLPHVPCVHRHGPLQGR